MKTPRKVYILENRNFIELTAEEHQKRKEQAPDYAERLFIPIQGCLMETDKEFYTDFYRDRERQRYLKKLDEKFGLLSIEAFDNEDGNGEDYIPDNAEDIAETVARNMMYEKLHTVLAELPEDDRQLIEALFFEGISEREYATRLGISQVAVHKRKHRILENLKKLLEI